MSHFKMFEKYASENFSTSLLAFCMAVCPRFKESIVRLMLARSRNLMIKDLRIDELAREYPITLDDATRKRPDLLVRGIADQMGFVVLLEAKIDVEFSPMQLSYYRSWLDSQPEHKDWKLLVTLTKRKYDPNELVDAQLLWAELIPEIAKVESENHSQFERSFWHELRLHVEDTMRTFTGFTTGYSDVLKLMQEVDMFLTEILSRLPIKKSVDYWQKERAAYYLPELKAIVGFYWWQKDFWREPYPNQFCVWKDGEKQPRPIVSPDNHPITLGEIIRNTNDPATSEEYILRITKQIARLCGVKTSSKGA
ncbi:MAG TPA: hypothetical protein VMB18_14665 [Terriglobales bacterium]|nr:hypothetical protein [Terriglobales bacterium]